MTAFLDTIWGHGGSVLDPVQMAVRAAAMFLVLLPLIRIGGARIFGKKSSFDNVVVILLGAIAARGVVGASPFDSTVAASAVIIGLHRVIAWLAVRAPRVSRLLKGERVPIYRDGQVLHANLRATTIGEDELMESLRLETRQATLAAIAEASLETNGRISFILAPRPPGPSIER